MPDLTTQYLKDFQDIFYICFDPLQNGRWLLIVQVKFGLRSS